RIGAELFSPSAFTSASVKTRSPCSSTTHQATHWIATLPTLSNRLVWLASNIVDSISDRCTAVNGRTRTVPPHSGHSTSRVSNRWRREFGRDQEEPLTCLLKLRFSGDLERERAAHRVLHRERHPHGGDERAEVPDTAGRVRQ